MSISRSFPLQPVMLFQKGKCPYPAQSVCLSVGTPGAQRTEHGGWNKPAHFHEPLPRVGLMLLIPELPGCTYPESNVQRRGDHLTPRLQKEMETLCLTQAFIHFSWCQPTLHFLCPVPRIQDLPRGQWLKPLCFALACLHATLSLRLPLFCLLSKTHGWHISSFNGFSGRSGDMYTKVPRYGKLLEEEVRNHMLGSKVRKKLGLGEQVLQSSLGIAIFVNHFCRRITTDIALKKNTCWNKCLLLQ